MASDATEIRHSDLIRFEHAAGAAFGCVDEDEGHSAPFVTAATAFAVATLATALAATISCLI